MIQWKIGLFHRAAAPLPIFEPTFKNVDDIRQKDAGCTSELDYTEQSSRLLFLKYLDALEIDKASEAELEGKRYSFILDGTGGFQGSCRLKIKITPPYCS